MAWIYNLSTREVETGFLAGQPSQISKQIVSLNRADDIPQGQPSAYAGDMREHLLGAHLELADGREGQRRMTSSAWDHFLGPYPNQSSKPPCSWQQES